MPYLIDGHNLIGKMPGISLQDPDDEGQLLARLRAFCARRRSSATVYFDAGAIGTRPERSQSGVTARFVSPATTADAAIRRHLARLGREAPNWTVVTSDSAVAEAARRSGARVESSERFARKLSEPESTEPASEKPQAAPGPEEIARWEAAFKKTAARKRNR